MNWKCRVITVLSVLCAASLSHAQQPDNLLLNGAFDYGAMKGVAFEWVADGIGSATIENGAQSILRVPSGEHGTVYQIVPRCTVGSSYRLSSHIVNLSGPGVTAWIGLAPSGDSDFNDIAWKAMTAPGIATVDVIAQDTNVIAYLAVTNTNSPGSLGAASFDEASLVLVQGEQNPPETRERPGRAEFAAAMNLLERFIPGEAHAAFSRVVHDLPDSRPDAAMALVRMTETADARAADASVLPRKQREIVLEISNLRQALRSYPEQAEPCALAQCKLGEYYLDRISPQLGRDILERTVRNYPDTEGQNWARLALINYETWLGDPAKAEQHFNAVKDAHDRGKANDAQMAWAEHRFLGQKITGYQERLDFLENLADKYKTSAREAASRIKGDQALAMIERTGMHKLGDVARELEELIRDYGDMHFQTDGFRIELGKLYRDHGGIVSYRQRARALFQEVIDAPDATDNHKKYARIELNIMNEQGTDEPHYPPPGHECLMGRSFVPSIPGQFCMWKLYGACSNWPSCDWVDPEGEPVVMPAGWNTVNCGKPTPLETHLVHEAMVASPSKPFTAKIWVAAEGWDGGDLSETWFELNTRFMDGLHNDVGEFTTGRLQSNGHNKEWQLLEINGVSPADAVLFEYSIRFRTAGPGHHAVLLYRPSMIFGGEE